jgi:hypothetical protein
LSKIAASTGSVPRQHREINHVTRPGVNLDNAPWRLDDRHGVEDTFRQPGDPYFGQPRPSGGEQFVAS